MKRLIGLLFALVVVTPATVSASQIVMIEPTKIVGSTWVEFMPNDGGAAKGNAWVNVWPSDKSVGLYTYTQIADAYTQMYGGLAVRKGLVEVGVGLGVENIAGEVGLRKSVYAIATAGRFQSANWFEQSNQGGSWGLSQNLYAVDPGLLDLGFRFQRYLGGGPMARMTIPNVGRFQPQLYVAALYDGDGFNPIVGLNVNF
jgi:hypothetical protein